MFEYQETTTFEEVSIVNGGIKQLLEVMNQLRAEQGCPWDRKQTMETLLPYTQEETWELTDAILSGDEIHIEEELGDVLFQVVFYAKISEEQGWSNFDTVALKMAEKLVRRHPHVFANEVWGDDKDRLVQWEKIKRAEKKQQTTEKQLLLDDIPASLPPLLKAKKLQKRAASVGFDWPDCTPVFTKIDEEIGELKEAMELSQREQVEEEFGDLMFTLVNLGRHLKIDPGIALEKCNRKFSKRFGFIEKSLTKEKLNLEQASLEKMELLWQQAKTSAK